MHLSFNFLFWWVFLLLGVAAELLAGVIIYKEDLLPAQVM